MPRAVARRDFFRRINGAPTPVRPPGSLGESVLDTACTRCNDCIRACPEAILVTGAGGLPQVDFAAGACTFCGRCGEACETGAILPAAGWTLSATISPACLEPQGITCRVCESACDAAALRFRPQLGGRTLVVVDRTRCTGCGACVAICPAAAITIAEPHPDSEPDCEESQCPAA